MPQTVQVRVPPDVHTYLLAYGSLDSIVDSVLRLCERHELDPVHLAPRADDTTVHTLVKIASPYYFEQLAAHGRIGFSLSSILTALADEQVPEILGWVPWVEPVQLPCRTAAREAKRSSLVGPAWHRLSGYSREFLVSPCLSDYGFCTVLHLGRERQVGDSSRLTPADPCFPCEYTASGLREYGQLWLDRLDAHRADGYFIQSGWALSDLCAEHGAEDISATIVNTIGGL